MSWPIATSDVTAYLGVTPAGDADQVALDRATAAVVAWVARNVEGIPVPATPGDPVEVGADIELGAVMLAARWYARRSSSQGIASFGDFGPAYVSRHDPDIASLLRLDWPGLA
jgi:hypothetical protein